MIIWEPRDNEFVFGFFCNIMIMSGDKNMKKILIISGVEIFNNKIEMIYP